MKKNHHSADVAAGLILFCLFTVLMLFVLISGAGAYKNISAAMEEQYCERTCLNYIAAKLRHYDENGSVSVGEFAGGSALFLEETADGDVYTTVLYYYDGSVRELFFPKGSAVTPEDGFTVIAADGISFAECGEGLFQAVCTVEGRSAQICVFVRSERFGEAL